MKNTSCVSCEDMTFELDRLRKKVAQLEDALSLETKTNLQRRKDFIYYGALLDMPIRIRRKT
ncbi:MAG: hypothetical protein ACYTFQ_02775 [Planctomycetota bacterium]